MRQWEHFAKEVDMQTKKAKLHSGELVTVNDYLKMMGAKGWELVAVAPVIRNTKSMSGTTCTFCTSREKRKRKMKKNESLR